MTCECVFSGWYLEDVRIYVEEDTGWQVQPRKAEINVLDSSQTIIHDAGRPSYSRSIQFVVFSGYDNDIVPLAGPGTVTLSNDVGETVEVHIKNLKSKRLYATNYCTPVYRVTMELVKNGV